MTDPKRWSSPGSEVDPVLRSVFRYAQGLAPSASETQSLMRRVEAAERERGRLRRGRLAARPRFGTAKAAVLAAAFGAALGSVAFAGYAVVHEARLEAGSRQADSSQAEARRSPRAKHSPKISAAPAPSAEPAELEASAVEPPQPVKAREPSRAVNAQSASPTPEASLQSEAELLQSARARLSSDPEDALRQTRAHAVRFPASVLDEERSALEIEALLRLSRSAEAESALLRFEAQHPRSPYRRRLRALLP